MIRELQIRYYEQKHMQKIYITNRTPNKICIANKEIIYKNIAEDVDLIITCASFLDLNTLKDFEHFSLKQTAIFTT